MFKHPKAVGAALFVFALAGAAPASAETLSAGAIKKLFPGTYQARVDGHTVTIRARANGTMTGSVMIASDKGRRPALLASNTACAPASKQEEGTHWSCAPHPRSAARAALKERLWGVLLAVCACVRTRAR